MKQFNTEPGSSDKIHVHYVLLHEVFLIKDNRKSLGNNFKSDKISIVSRHLDSSHTNKKSFPIYYINLECKF